LPNAGRHEWLEDELPAGGVVTSHIAIWGIAGLATAGVILRPMNLPEAVWALAGALVLVCLGLLPVSAALEGMGKGVDVYLFLTGMMLLAELARQEGLFDWMAARAVSTARGSATRLFGLVYGVGIVVTVFLSNDATAVVLTPAVAAVARTAKVERPLPYLFICAFIANAASFVLPISNPANLVIYANQMPPLLQWLPRFALPSLLSISVTYAVLRWTQRGALAQSVSIRVTVPSLSRAGKLTASGIAAAAGALMLASAFGIQLGLPTCIAGLLTLCAVSLTVRSSPWRFLRAVPWGVIPLVAGLFVLVEALDRSGVIQSVRDFLREQAQHSEGLAAAGAGIAVGIVSNLINNLPAGLIAGTAVQSANVPPNVTSAILIGVDLGPNLSVTGSLATILWLGALRRDGIRIKAWDFLKLGLLIMPPALVLALGALLLVG
jgi:arsenical pump membrane protein